MTWEQVRRRRLPLHFLRGTWQAIALNHPEGFAAEAQWQGVIELHCLRFSALNGLHTIYIHNLDPEAVEFDGWSADLDITEEGQMISAPFWDLDRIFENKGVIPHEIVTQVDERNLALTVWHIWDKITPRTFRLTKLNNDIPWER